VSGQERLVCVRAGEVGLCQGRRGWFVSEHAFYACRHQSILTMNVTLTGWSRASALRKRKSKIRL
jgi:hypothetical protein